MTDYRRPHVAGTTVFFTVALAKRHTSLLTDRIACLRTAWVRTQRAHPFRTVAVCVLPDHLHTVWVLPADDADFGTRWGLIKAGFSRQIAGDEWRSASRRARGERGIWQRRFWEHTVRDEDDLRAHIDYVHINPVKHGLMLRASDWPYSSMRRYVRAGVLSADWGCAVGPRPGHGGE